MSPPPGGRHNNSPPIHWWVFNGRQIINKREGIDVSHSYVSNYIHFVFSTKGRENYLSNEIQDQLYSYIRGIIQNNDMKLICIGGIENHIHILVSISSNQSIAKFIQLIKGNSSKWINDTFSKYQKFQWQEGYGAFSISISHLDSTIKYINNQKEHHKKITFKEEFIAFLKKHGIPYDGKYIYE